MSSKLILSIVVLVVAVGALAVGAAALLHQPDAPDDASEREPATGVDAPTLTPMSHVERVQKRHDLPWPFAEFSSDIAELRRPVRRDVTFERDRIERELNRKLIDTKLHFDLQDAKVVDVVQAIKGELAPQGFTIYTQDPPVENDITFDRIAGEGRNVFDVIEEMRVRSDDLVKFALTPAGLCIGSKVATIDARAAAQRWEEEQVGDGHPESAFDFLEGEYRADFSGAHIGYVIRDIKEQTGVQVVVGPETWAKPVTLSWTADPMPVYGALRQIAIKAGGALYAKDGRVFLLDR